MKEKIPTVSMKMRKKDIFEAGKVNFFRYLELAENYEKLKIVNAGLINSLKHILAHVDLIEFAYADDDGTEDEPVVKPKVDNTRIEVQ